MKKIVLFAGMIGITCTGAIAQTNNTINQSPANRIGIDTPRRLPNTTTTPLNNKMNTQGINQLPNGQSNSNYNNNSMQNNAPGNPNTSPLPGNGTYTDPTRNTPPTTNPGSTNGTQIPGNGR